MRSRLLKWAGVLVAAVLITFALFFAGTVAINEVEASTTSTICSIDGSTSNASIDEIEVAARALNVAHDHGASRRVMIATVMTISVESGFNPNLTESQSDRDSAGAFQQRRHWVPADLRPSIWNQRNEGTLGYIPDDPRVNLEWSTANFLEPKVNGIRGALYWDRRMPASVSPGQIAQLTQISAFPHRYDERREEAEEIIPLALQLLDEEGEILTPSDICADGTLTSGPITGKVACPVGEPHTFTNTWGYARSGGRTHKGVDIFADIGIPIYAYQGGEVRLTSSPLGGTSLWITNDNGDRFYYAHLSGYARGIETGTRVETGQLVGYNGNTGNARFTPPHLHWEIHPAGRGAVDPTPYASAVCSGG